MPVRQRVAGLAGVLCPAFSDRNRNASAGWEKPGATGDMAGALQASQALQALRLHRCLYSAASGPWSSAGEDEGCSGEMQRGGREVLCGDGCDPFLCTLRRPTLSAPVSPRSLGKRAEWADDS